MFLAAAAALGLTGSPRVAQAGLELSNLMLSSPSAGQVLGSRWALPYLANLSDLFLSDHLTLFAS